MSTAESKVHTATTRVAKEETPVKEVAETPVMGTAGKKETSLKQEAAAVKQEASSRKMQQQSELHQE